jgi:hypothetical protein
LACFLHTLPHLLLGTSEIEGGLRMVRMLIVATALIGSATLAAQAPTPPQTPKPAAPGAQQPATPAPQAQAPAKAGIVTLSGCLKPGASAGSYILADASSVSAAAAGAEKPDPAAKGTTGATKSYNVTPGKVSDDLSKHLNHKIEVTGTVAAAAPSASAPSTAPAGAPAPTETVTLQTFKMVSAACP